MSSEPYFLAPHVYACATAHNVILLDLKRYRYTTVVPASRLRGWVVDWPRVGDTRDDASETEYSAEGETKARRLVAQMFALGMLVIDPGIGKPATPIAVQQPTSDLLPVPWGLTSRHAASLSDIPDFTRAFVKARAGLRICRFWKVIEALRARKQHAVNRELDLDAAKTQVAAYMNLRPFFFTARDRCMLDSLSMTHFLAHAGIFASWVFGVQEDPFAAHCWVQHGSIVFNDTPDNVRRFTPILQV